MSWRDLGAGVLAMLGATRGLLGLPGRGSPALMDEQTSRRILNTSCNTHTHTWRWSGEKHVQSMSASFETICNVTDWLTNHLIMRSIRVVKVSIYFDFKSWTMSNLNKPKYRSIEEALCFQGKVVLCDICHVKLALKCHGFLELVPRYTAPFLPGPEYRDQVLCTD